MLIPGYTTQVWKGTKWSEHSSTWGRSRRLAEDDAATNSSKVQISFLMFCWPMCFKGSIIIWSHLNSCCRRLKDTWLENIIQIKHKLKMINTRLSWCCKDNEGRLPVNKKVKTFDIVKVRRFALYTHTTVVMLTSLTLSHRCLPLTSNLISNFI